MPNQRITERFQRMVSNQLLPRLPIWAGILAVLLTLSSLGVGLLVDDHGILLAVRGDSKVYEHADLSPLDLFRFVDGNPDNARELMNVGMSPWWTDPEIKAAFWRPVTSITHFLDFRLWGNLTWLMHLQNVLLYGAVAAMAAALYRRLSGSTAVAVLGAILYAVDHRHGLPVGWLANRNAVLAALFGFLALWAHDRWRRESWKAGPFMATGAFALSLLSGEAGIATCAYLFAHAVFLDRHKFPKALLCLAPYAVTVVAWRIAWAAQGYGTAGMGMYTDPLHEPLVFLRALTQRMPLLLLSQWATPPAELYLALGPGAQRIHLAAAVAFLVVLAMILLPILRRNRSAGFFFTGMLLSLVPACATFPQDRMLLFAGLGAMGLIGEVMREALGQPSRLWPKWHVRIPAIGLAGLLALIHLVASPGFLAYRSAFPLGKVEESEPLFLLHPLAAGDEDRDLVVVNPLEPHLIWMSLARREATGIGIPRSMRALGPGQYGMTILRLNDRTLLVRPGRGFFAGFYNSTSMTDDYRMRVGHRIKLRGMTVEVTRTNADGHPLEARFIFDVPLENPRIRWLQWRGMSYEPFIPPPVGRTVQL